MAVEFKLGQLLDNCPPWWYNFVKEVNPEGGGDELVDNALATYGAKFIERVLLPRNMKGGPRRKNYVIFESEEHVTLFMLKFGGKRHADQDQI